MQNEKLFSCTRQQVMAEEVTNNIRYRMQLMLTNNLIFLLVMLWLYIAFFCFFTYNICVFFIVMLIATAFNWHFTIFHFVLHLLFYSAVFVAKFINCKKNNLGLQILPDTLELYWKCRKWKNVKYRIYFE